ncbi:MAG: ABC transporter permease subunit [Nitrososphaerota archaeon]
MNFFKAIINGCLIFASLFVVIIIFSSCLFTNPKSLILAIFSEEVIFAISLSISTATISTIIAIVLAVPAAYALSRANFAGKGLIDALLDIPIALPPVAIGTALLIFFTNTPLGVYINNSLIRFVFEVPGIILAQFSVVSFLAIRMLKPIFEAVDPLYIKVARVLGCNEIQSFFRVTLPLVRNGIFGAAIISWARALGEFGATVTLAGATRFKTETLPIAMYLTLATADIEKALALVLILLIVVLSILVITRRILRQIAFL